MSLLEFLHRKNNFTVESSDPDDIPQLLSLEKEAFYPGEERWDENDLRTELELRPEGMKIVKDGKKIVGYIQFQIGECDLIMEQQFNENDGIIGSIAVLKDYRRKGVGEYLLKAAIDTLKYQGVLKIIANTRHDNMEMLNLFDKFGFKKTGITLNYYGKGQDSVDFEKPLV